MFVAFRLQYGALAAFGDCALSKLLYRYERHDYQGQHKRNSKYLNDPVDTDTSKV